MVIMILESQGCIIIRAGSQRSSPASLPGFTRYFHCVDPQPSTFHKAPATQKPKENSEAIYCNPNNPCKKFKWQTS